MKKTHIKRIYLTVIFLFVCFAAPAGAGYNWPLLPQASAEKAPYNLSESKLFPKILAYTEKYYVEPERIDPKEMLKGTLDDLQKTTPEILVTYASPTSFTVTIDKSQKKFSSKLNDMDSLWEVLNEVLIFIELNYHGKVELNDIESIAINGALRTLDPHSAFFTPEFYKEFKIDTGGQFGGLGIVITSKDGQLMVITPIEDTPAWQSGIRSGDVITQIGDESTINMSLMKAVEKLRGKIGTKVTITVERKGKASPFEVTLTRAKIHIDSVKSTVIADDTESVGYIKLKRFQRDTYTEFVKNLKMMQTDAGISFKGLIIDLRNNPGGLLDQAVDIADLFLSKGIIVSTVGANKKFIDEESAHLKGTEPTTYPLIILINEGSASASEIVAGALQAHGRALIIGQRTFGKGSVQSVYELGDNYALKLTIAQYLNAGKYSIQTSGITPDITLEDVVVDKKLIDILPNKQSSEKELKKHLKQISPTAIKEKKAIFFYSPYIDEEDIDELRKKEYSQKLDFKDDFAAKLASKIILATRSPDPKAMLKESEKVVKKLEDQEEQKIASKLGELGTVWNTTVNKGTPKIVTTSSLTKDGKSLTSALAGSEIDLLLNVTNMGKETLHKLIGVIESDNPLLDEREFVFGELPPTASATRKSSIELPRSMVNQNIPYKVAFKRGGQSISDSYSSSLKVVALPHPKFAINYELEKPKTVGPRHPLPRGKSVPLSVKIKNVGKGSTKDAKAYISNKKNIDGLFIENGRFDLGVIKPGATKTAKFAFRVQPDMKPSTFVLELTISDRDLLQFLISDLEFTMESGAIKPSAGIWHEGPQIELASKKLPIVTDSSNYTLKGKIMDNIAIKDYYLLVNDEKVSYRSNPKESSTLNIEATFKLKDGNNNVAIIARNINDIANFESIIIQKGKFE